LKAICWEIDKKDVREKDLLKEEGKEPGHIPEENLLMKRKRS
jgi:hypothetical protein